MCAFVCECDAKQLIRNNHLSLAYSKIRPLPTTSYLAVCGREGCALLVIKQQLKRCRCVVVLHWGAVVV